MTHFALNSVSASPQTMSQNMPSISEDEHIGEADEPPDHPLHRFRKTTPPPNTRRPSLLTKALHTDSESHDESLGFSRAFKRQTSRSSTASTWSVKTDPTSDDAPMSSPSSPIRSTSFQPPHQAANSQSGNEKPPAAAGSQEPKQRFGTSPGGTSEPVVEEKLGRKRCISFACGGQKAQEKQAAPKQEDVAQMDEPVPAPPRRACTLKFVCPSKVSSCRASRHNSPPPPQRAKSPSPMPTLGRPHRDSDTTIKNASPKTMRKVPPMEPRKSAPVEPEEDPSEATRFHEFAGTKEEVDDWMQESTCHRSRLTVDDTLEKEKTIRDIGKEAEDEALEEEEEEDAMEDALSGPVDSDDDDQVSDPGFQTDDEEGFAESDNESDSDSDYEWWAPNRSSPAEATMAPGDAIRLPAMHPGSPSSLNSLGSPKRRDRPFRLPSKPRRKPKSEAIRIRPSSPELPDSTDFVCGTLDEDKPLEEAYASCIEQRRAAKHHIRPQDIDPTFPDEPIEPDEDDEDAAIVPAKDDESDHLVHGAMEDIDYEEELEDDDEDEDENEEDNDDHDDDEDDEPRGRRRDPNPTPSPQPTHFHLPSNTPRATSVQRIRSATPTVKPGMKRPKSPMPATMSTKVGGTTAPKHGATKTGQRLRSPAPRALFGVSPRRLRSPPPPTKIRSPPPSRRPSPSSTIKPIPFGTAFLGQRPQLTHTTSLPRSPNPFAYKRAPFEQPASATSDGSDADEGEDTATESKMVYTRGAIDIVQGLERKRLRRRQKFYEKYCRKEEKKRERGEVKRPPPGKGAQRMRQVGIESAIYHGQRVLSI